MIKTFKFFLSFMLLSSNFYGDDVIDTLNKKFGDAEYSINISMVNGKELLSYNSNKLLVPASSLKVVTTLYALEKLGADFRFKTDIKYSGDIKDGVLYGDLYIVGGGDMTLGSENFGSDISKVFENILNTLKKAGIKSINGDIFADSSLINDFEEPTWEWRDIGNYYAARVTGLSLNDNSYKIYFKTGNETGMPAEVIKTEPPVGFKITNYVLTGLSGSGDNSYIYSNPYMDEIIIRGSIGKTDNLFIIKGSMKDPQSFFARNFFEYLKKNGVSANGWNVIYEKNDNSNNKNLKLLDTLYSPELYKIITVTNRKSFNFYAESLLRYAGIKGNRVGVAENIVEIENFLKNAGINNFNIIDGSGLSRSDLFSASGFVKLLNYAHKKVYFNYFYDSLSSWKSGDAKGHIKNFGQEDNLDIRIKSGSLNMVRSYVGYLNSKKYGLLSFSFIINNYTTDPQKIDNTFEEILKRYN
jgi:D-alanyl-D-alanine carboxypeptidase/D-alanyl-D-alanine-endopeptidase (penicillin-binding protein 4)